MTRFGMIAACALAAALPAGCGATARPPDPQVVDGEIRTIGDGTVRAWLTLAHDGIPVAVGVTLTEAALAALRQHADTAITLRLPPQAAVRIVDHIELAWTREAGAPHDAYAQPRLDARFHLVPLATRAAFDDADRAAAIPPLQRIPPRYVPNAGFAPGHGVRWIDPTAPEFRGEPFAVALLYGFHGGRIVFLEPRVSLAILESRTDTVHDIEPPREPPPPGYFPTRYSVRYDAAAHEHTIALEGLVRAP